MQNSAESSELKVSGRFPIGMESCILFTACPGW
jgi:hypothetical protein